MYKMLVVDDEKIERTGIRFLVSEYSIELEVAEAENGERALEYIKHNPVDILLTDIRMPFMDGLELIDRARKVSPGIKNIIFSAYDEFEYAKKAIDLNVTHYILKPIDDTEFLQVVNNVIDLCNIERNESEKIKNILESYNKGLQYAKEKILLDIVHGNDISGLPERTLLDCGIDFSGKTMILVLVGFKSRFFDSNNKGFVKQINSVLRWNYEYVNLNEYQSLIFFKDIDEIGQAELENFGEVLRKKINESYAINACIVISEPICSIDRIREQYLKVEQVFENGFLFDSSIVLFAGRDYANLDNSEQSIEKAIKKNRKIIKDVINIIAENYMKDISVEMIADKVYLSADYLSRIFKESTGYSLRKYITSYRMKKAEELLNNTNMKIVDISRKVGYSNLSYFCMIFKNNYGISPAKYRENGD